MLCWECRHDPATLSALAREMARSLRDPAPERGDLLRLPLFPRHARREGVDRTRDRLSDSDADLAVAQSDGDRVDHPQLLGLSRGGLSGDFPTGTAAWLGRTGGASDLLAHERKTRNGA